MSRSEARLATQHTGSSDPVEGADRLLLDRLRMGLRLLLAGVAAAFVGGLLVVPDVRPQVSVIQAINIIVIAMVLPLLKDPARRASNLTVGFAAYAVTVVAAGAVGIVAGDATTPVVLFAGLGMVTATWVPWSPWWQLLNVSLLTATAVWTVATVVNTPRLFWVQNVGAMAAALAPTVVISHVLRRERIAVERAERERCTREERLREANEQLGEEVQEHRKTENALRFAMRELDHRVKNTLATVQAVADQTLRASRSMDEFSDAFRGRIHAMARIHDALARRRWEGLTLAELIELIVGPYRYHVGSVSIECDGSFVPSRIVRVLGMALHELATNAAKYGALSTKEGRVAIASRLDANGASRLRICWSERNGPLVSEPARRGFGMKLIEEALAYEVDGRVSVDFSSEGLRCKIEIPVPPVSA